MGVNTYQCRGAAYIYYVLITELIIITIYKINLNYLTPRHLVYYVRHYTQRIANVDDCFHVFYQHAAALWWSQSESVFDY